MANYENKIRELVRILDYIDRRSIDYEKEPEAFKWLSLGLSDYKEYFELVKELKQTPAFKINYGVKDPDTFLREVSGNQIIDIINFYKTLSNSPEEVYREVPIKIIGESIPVKEGRAEINFYYKEVTLKGLLSDIPNSVNLNISALTKIGDELTVSDIVVPAKVTIVTNSDTVLVDLQKLGEKETEIPTPPEEEEEEEEEKREEKKESRTETEEEEKPKKEVSSVPPEIEGLVEEYRQNQARLEEEEVKSSHQRTVAEQVKIALAHSNIREQIMANRREREAAGEKFRDTDKTIVDLGSPRDLSVTNVLAPSFKAIQRTAFTYEGFENLSPQIQNQIISQAVELNTIGISDVDVAIQTASLQLGIKDISSSFTTEIVEEINDIDLQTNELENKLSQNESSIDSLQSKTSLTISEQQQLDRLLKENSILSSGLDKISTRFVDFVDTQSERFKQHLNLIEDHRKKDPDLQDYSETANKKIAIIQENLVKNGVVGRSFSDLDKIEELVSVIQKDIPGLHKYASYEGSQAAAIIGGNQGQVVLAYSRGVTGQVLRQAEKFAAANPNSATAKFLSNNTKVFRAARRSIRELENSKLGKDIIQVVGKANFVVSVVTNPVGALKSWAGKKAGEQLRKRLVEKIGNKVIKDAFSILTKEGIKDGVKTLASKALAKMAAKAATWAALKLGISVALLAVPYVGLLLEIAAQALIWVAEKVISAAYNAFQSAAESVYGEKIKGRDILALLAAPVAVAATAGAAVFGGLVFLTRTAQVAVVSATGIIIGSVVTIGLYTGFAYLVAPILSTLVQFDAVEKVNYPAYDEIASSSGDCAWPTKGHYVIITGPRGGTHHLSQLEAIDIGAPDGSPLLSATSGTVTFTGVYSNYGNTVKIESQTSAGKTLVIYGHLSETSVGEGQKVNQGQQIGLVGGSGGWSPHIHMEYQGIKYNQCPAGGLKIKEECCIPYDGGICSGTCDAFSN